MAGGARLFAAVAGLVLIVGGGLFLSQSMQARSPVAKASQDTPRSRPTAKALYLASIAPEGGEPTVGPLHNWTLTVATADGAPVAGAKVAVDGGMPDHDHGLPTAPRVTAELPGGRYRIEGVKFTMPGKWVLKFTITAAPGTDEASFDLTL